MEKYIQSAYEFYRQDVKENYLSYEQFKAKICKTTVPCWAYFVGGAAVGYALKK